MTDTFVTNLSQQQMMEEFDKAIKNKKTVKKAQSITDPETELLKDMNYFETITTTKMLTDLNNAKKQPSNDMNMFCRDDTMQNKQKCCRENCIKASTYKNIVTGEYVCWYHSYVK